MIRSDELGLSGLHDQMPSAPGVDGHVRQDLVVFLGELLLGEHGLLADAHVAGTLQDLPALVYVVIRCGSAYRPVYPAFLELGFEDRPLEQSVQNIQDELVGIVADAPAGFGDRIIDCLLHLLDGLIDLRRRYLPLPEDALIGERTKVSRDYETVRLSTCPPYRGSR